MNITPVLVSALKNFAIPDSVRAGGGAAVLTVAVGSILVALGVSVPFLNVPLTMSMVLGAAIPIGHVITALMPDSFKQQVDALGTKVGAQITELKAITPVIDPSYPNGRNGQTAITIPVTASNINK